MSSAEEQLARNSDPDKHQMTQAQIMSAATGLRPGAFSHNVQTDTSNDGRIENTPAVPNKATTPPDGSKQGKPHVSLTDKIKGQYKIALGGMKHDVHLAQEGEDLKNGDKDRLH